MLCGFQSAAWCAFTIQSACDHLMRTTRRTLCSSLSSLTGFLKKSKLKLVFFFFIYKLMHGKACLILKNIYVLAQFVILNPHSPSTYMVLYSLETLSSIGQPTSSPAHSTPWSLPLWMTWLAERSIHLPHLLVHFGNPQPERQKID